MERVKHIAQKRTTLKTQITNLGNLLTEERIDANNARLRLDRLTELFHAYEELHDELAILDPTNDRLAEFDDIQYRFYELASKIKGSQAVNSTCNETLNATAAPTDRTRRIKLPVPELPTFDGSIEKWLSYKNTFTTMIYAREDTSDLERFIYLKNSLRGEALNKISIYDASAENFEHAWKLLSDSYEKPRILRSKHIDAILELSVTAEPLARGLTKLVDDMKQHINMLASLKVKPDEHFLVRIIERALPRNIRVKWEEKLTLDSSPKLDDIYQFLAETSFRLASLQEVTSRNRCTPERKRGNDYRDERFKRRKHETNAQAFVTTAKPTCSICNSNQHRERMCHSLTKAPISRRWEIIKQHNLCKNCLRRHDGLCSTNSRCKICSRFHHTMLHNPKQSTQSQRMLQNEPSVSDTTTLSKNPESL